MKTAFITTKLILFYYLFVILFLFASNKSWAENTAKNQKPIIIRSDFITIKQKSQQVKFLQNVVVEQDDSSLLANEMVVDYLENNNKKREINLITANKNVKLFNQNITTCSKGCRLLIGLLQWAYVLNGENEYANDGNCLPPDSPA